MVARRSRANREVGAALGCVPQADGLRKAVPTPLAPAFAHRQIEQAQYVWILDGGGGIR